MSSFQFANRTIFIVSPEKWGKMRVSKHHYALELADIGCTVFFIEPPNLSNTEFRITACADHPSIKIVSYKPVFRGRRFLPKPLFKLLLKLQVKTLLKKIGTNPDVLLNFHGDLFENLKWFNAHTSIFFAADLNNFAAIPPEVYTATVSFAVSDSIFDRINKSGKKVFRINHGLQKSFLKAAKIFLENGLPATAMNNKVSVGYIGNLRIESKDRKKMMEVIRLHPEIKFVFWGSYKKTDATLGGLFNQEVDEYISFLENAKNVELRGVLNGKELLSQMLEVDLFCICLLPNVNIFQDASNSHKVLEYLSTGKPVVSTYLSSYKDSDLLYMLPTSDNEGYMDLFDKTLELIKNGEPKQTIMKRLNFAIENSYSARLKEIEKLINE